MAISTDRVSEFLEGNKRNRRVLLSPEGVPLDIQIAGNGERLGAFALDIAFMFATIFCLYVLLFFLFFSKTNLSVGMTLVLFLAFIVRNLYFLHFELAWQGRTPGKRICGLRVINRNGGELTPAALVARNLTREVEFFLPLSLFLGLDFEDEFLPQLTLFGWVLAIGLLPLFNRNHLRAGDLIAGTQVIAMPKRVLLPDLAARAREKTPDASNAYTFTHDQLAIYGAFELQILEELLRRPHNLENMRVLVDVCEKICAKIGWTESVPPVDIRRFLTDFYAAERAHLERGQLFGRTRLDKTGAVETPDSKQDRPM